MAQQGRVIETDTWRRRVLAWGAIFIEDPSGLVEDTSGSVDRRFRQGMLKFFESARRKGRGMTPEQCRMARAGLSISTRELADSARVSVSTITRFESGQAIPTMTVGLFQKALERQGVDFVSNGPNVGLWLTKSPGIAPAISVEGLNATNDE